MSSASYSESSFFLLRLITPNANSIINLKRSLSTSDNSTVCIFPLEDVPFALFEMRERTCRLKSSGSAHCKMPRHCLSWRPGRIFQSS